MLIPPPRALLAVATAWLSAITESSTDRAPVVADVEAAARRALVGGVVAAKHAAHQVQIGLAEMDAAAGDRGLGARPGGVSFDQAVGDRERGRVGVEVSLDSTTLLPGVVAGEGGAADESCCRRWIGPARARPRRAFVPTTLFWSKVESLIVTESPVARTPPPFSADAPGSTPAWFEPIVDPSTLRVPATLAPPPLPPAVFSATIESSSTRLPRLEMPPPAACADLLSATIESTSVRLPFERIPPPGSSGSSTSPSVMRTPVIDRGVAPSWSITRSSVPPKIVARVAGMAPPWIATGPPTA